jgi:NAD(P)-dependent dehydrogenase (short-subunit alcohol dehydrogenase family)
MSTSNKVAVVTGGASGIGAAASERLASDGYAILIADLAHDAADATARRLSHEYGVAATSIACDIGNPDDCEAAATYAISQLGGLDALVNCAGISKPGDSLTYSPSDWRRMIDIQLNGAFFVAQACGRAMVAQRNGGAIVFMSSTNAEAAFPRRAAYCAAKAGVAMLTKVLAIEWAQHRVRVNAVGPAYVETEMTKRNIEAGNISREAIEKRIPLGRLAQPGDVSDAVAFLLSNQASFITGHTLYVDGGWLAYGYL